MSCRDVKLPFLPGFTFNNNIGKTYFGRDPLFERKNNVQILVEKIRPGIPGKINERYPSVYARGEVSELPGWISFNKETLTFDAYFQETMHEMKGSPFQIRKCKIYFYLEDGTVKIVEPKVVNSGIPQGTLLSRQRVALPPPKNDLFYDIVDFNVGKEIEIYGKNFKLVNCDIFTRNFLNRLGIVVRDPIGVPEDPYISARLKTDVKYSKKCKSRTDPFGKFLENDKKILRFYGYWDERDTGGFLHDLIVYFYLADDNIEIREIFEDSHTTSLFIRKGKIPKRYHELPQPGYYDEVVTLNAMSDRWGRSGSSYVLDPLRVGVNDTEYYEPRDLAIGAIINVYGKKIFLTGCDEFTKNYYTAKYGLNDFTAIEKPKTSEKLYSVESVKRKLPPWNGFGTHEDSAQYCLSFEPKPLTQNVKKFLLLDRDGYDSRILRFKAVMRGKNANNSRIFIMSYYLCDDTIAINETREGNSGPLFLRREKMPLPGQEVFTSEPPEYYEPHHLFIGATITVNSFQFILIDADEYALRYMEIHCNQFPKANINLIMDKVKAKLKPIYKDFVAEFMPNEQPVIPFEVLREKLLWVMGDDFTEHEMITLARHFSANCRQSPRHSRQFIRQIVLTELNRLLWDDLEKFKENLRGIDIYKSGYIPRNKAYNLIRSSRLPLDKIVIENMLDVLEKNDKCEISGDDLCKFLDHNYFPINHIAPINMKTDLWWPSEPEPIAGKLIDWCAFNKSLDLEYIFNEKIQPAKKNL